MPCGSWEKSIGQRNNPETAERTPPAKWILAGAAGGFATGKTERHKTGEGVTAHQHIGAKTVAEHGRRYSQHEDEGTEGKEEGGFHVERSVGASLCKARARRFMITLNVFL